VIISETESARAGAGISSLVLLHPNVASTKRKRADSLRSRFMTFPGGRITAGGFAASSSPAFQKVIVPDQLSQSCEPATCACYRESDLNVSGHGLH